MSDVSSAFIKAYEKLEGNIVDIMVEEQAKLGYRKESVRLYYPLSSLSHFFEETDVTTERMNALLSGFPEYMSNKYGDVGITNKGDRFCFTMSELASEYVHNKREDNKFIQQLVDLVGRHGTTMQQITELFKNEDESCIIDNVDNGEFDILIKFSDSKDRYFYCFKDEGCHIIYHRFLPEDYYDLGF